MDHRETEMESTKGNAASSPAITFVSNGSRRSAMSKGFALVAIGLLCMIIWLTIDTEKTVSAYELQVEQTAQRIEVLDSTIAFLRGESDDLELAISEQDSLIAKLEYQGWQYRVKLKDARTQVETYNQIIEYNETDSALVELLRSAYSDRIESGH